MVQIQNNSKRQSKLCSPIIILCCLLSMAIGLGMASTMKMLSFESAISAVNDNIANVINSDNGSSSASSAMSTTASTEAAAAVGKMTNDNQATMKKQSSLPSYRTSLMYGTKSGKEDTARLVKDAILTGFRHVVTGNHHGAHNETGVGIGWKLAIKENPTRLSRSDLFIQSCFIPWDGKDFKKQPGDPDTIMDSIEEQVHYSIKTSLENLQTTYIDAILFHNFRAKIYGPYDKMIQAWKILEEYVNKGVVRYLGFTSIHDVEYLERLMNDPQINIKPSIIQNRYHSNRGYDVNMQAIFQKYNIQVQRFWLLNGSSRGGKGNEPMAKFKNVTPAQLMLGFVMSMGESCIVGTHSLQHMKEDVTMSQCYDRIFKDDNERFEYAKKLGVGKNSKFKLTKPSSTKEESNQQTTEEEDVCPI